MITDEPIRILSNRPGPFTDLGVPADTSFTPLSLSPDEQELHTMLKLDFIQNDHYLIGHISALLSNPEIAHFFQGATTYDLARLNPTGVISMGGHLLQSEGLVAYYTGQDSQLPLAFTYTIEYVSATSCLIKAVEKGLTLAATCAAIGDVLRIDWPAQIPFSGPIVPDVAWAEGSLITFRVRPHNFPYSGFLELIKSNLAVPELLRNFQLVQEYALALDSVEKLSYVLIALYLSRKARHLERAANLPDEQYDGVGLIAPPSQTP